MIAGQTLRVCPEGKAFSEKIMLHKKLGAGDVFVIPLLRISLFNRGPAHRMSDMRLGLLPHSTDEDHSAQTLSGRVAHMSPSSSGAAVQ